MDTNNQSNKDNASQRRQLLLRRFTTAYTGIDQGTVDLYYERLEYYLELCDWHGKEKKPSAEIKRDRQLYQPYLISAHQPLDETKLRSFLSEVAGIPATTCKTIEWADHVFDAFSLRQDPEVLVTNQESGKGLPLEPGFSCLGKYIGEAITSDGAIELRDNCTSTLDQYFLIITTNDLYGGLESQRGEIAVRLTDLSIQDFGEMLEDACGTRSQRSKIERDCNVNNENRALPFADTPKKRKPLKRRPGFGRLLCGLQAESNAIVELREGKYHPYLLIEETGPTPHITTLSYVPEDPYNDDESKVAIAQLNYFQLVELFEIAEPLLGRRIPSHERLVTGFLREDAMRSINRMHSSEIAPNAPVELRLENEN
jgi:hypothetical protein